jgi:hypothetical protein
MTEEQKMLHELWAKQECYEAICRLQRGLDRIDGDLLLSAFHPGGIINVGQYDGPIEDFVPWVSGHLSKMKRTHHHIGNNLIELRGDVAFSETYIFASHDFTRDGKDLTYLVNGRYADRLERRNGKWRIVHRTLIADLVAEYPTEEGTQRSGPFKRNWGTRGKEDVSYRR